MNQCCLWGAPVHIDMALPFLLKNIHFFPHALNPSWHHQHRGHKQQKERFYED
jgi:hypothetical protein